MEGLVQTSAVSVIAFFVTPIQEAVASGGATAGGAYLLSAKQRYNERVQQGVKGYVGLQTALEAGNIDAIRAFFSNEDVGRWKDFSAAGYLLANAFRRNSTAAPDSLPSVKVCSLAQNWKLRKINFFTVVLLWSHTHLHSIYCRVII
jgi:hypothetical protein